MPNNQPKRRSKQSIFISLQVTFPYSHDLELLLALVPDDWQLKIDLSDLSRLSDWAVDARYPDTPEEATTEDALNAIQTAQTVFDVVTADLRQRGFEYEAE